MNFGRFFVILAILLPYKLLTMKQNIAFGYDLLVAMVAFGLGAALFPPKNRFPEQPPKNNPDILDQNQE